MATPRGRTSSRLISQGRMPDPRTDPRKPAILIDTLRLWCALKIGFSPELPDSRAGSHASRVISVITGAGNCRGHVQPRGDDRHESDSSTLPTRGYLPAPGRRA